MTSTRRPYRTDLSDARWALIEPMLSAWRACRAGLGISPIQHDLREIVNAILYVNRTGIAWEYLPHDFPPFKTVHGCVPDRSDVRRARQLHDTEPQAAHPVGPHGQPDREPHPDLVRGRRSPGHRWTGAPVARPRPGPGPRREVRRAGRGGMEPHHPPRIPVLCCGAVMMSSVLAGRRYGRRTRCTCTALPDISSVHDRRVFTATACLDAPVMTRPARPRTRIPVGSDC